MSLQDSVSNLKAPIYFRTQSHDPISCHGKPVERTNEIKGYETSLVPLHWFPVATDQIVGLSPTVDRGLTRIDGILSPVSLQLKLQNWNTQGEQHYVHF